MKKCFYELFPIPVLHVENFLSKENIDIAKKFIFSNLDKSQEHLALYSGSSTFNNHKSFNVLRELEIQYESWRKVSLDLSRLFKEFSEFSNLNFVGIRVSWFNVQKKISLLKPHIHSPGVNIVGTLYIDVGPGSSPICFYNEFNNRKSVDYVDHNIDARRFSCEYYKFYPESGDLIIFPAYLSHGSDEINFYDNRTVISFNS